MKRITLFGAVVIGSALLGLVSLVKVNAADRFQINQIDSSTSGPVRTSFVAVTNLTTATQVTNTVVGLTCLLTNVVGNTTNVFTIVTNVQGVAVGTGFANIGQANAVISNNALIYQMVQPQY